MSGNKMYVDIGSMLDELFDAAKNFGEEMRDNFGPGLGPMHRAWSHGREFDENTDWYPNFSYPPMNIYLTPDRVIFFEFAVAGFDEKDISLSFQGDYMIFSARIGLEAAPEDGVRFIKRRLKLKDIEKQKYYVPADKFAQEKVKAVFKNGILKVSVPPKEEMETPEGIKIEIVKEEGSN